MTGSAGNLVLAAVCLAFIGLGALVLTGCGNDKPEQAEEQSDRGKKPTAASGEDDGMLGVWYEQSENRRTLTVTADELVISSADWSSNSAYELKPADEGMELVMKDEYWPFPDVFYYPDEERIIMHTMPHLDGDGGYKLMVFLKQRYEIPPAPVYGERTDNSDPDAPKSFTDHSVQELSLKVYEPTRQYGDMAPEEPREGWYEYSLTRNPDGRAVIEYEPCPVKITVSAERMEELAAFLENSSLDQLNGLDVWTEGMPDYTQRYELYMKFTDGSEYRSRANGPDIDHIWDEEGFELHRFIMESLMAAGYSYYTGEYHSTEPMLRLGRGDEADSGYRIIAEDVSLEKAGNAYEYKVSTSYPSFTADGAVPAPLMDSLNEFAEHYRVIAEKSIEEDYELMEAVPKKIWSKEDHRSAYSLYATEREQADGMFYNFYFTEGHVNSFGLDPWGYGTYIHFRVYFDAESGKMLSVSDLVNDPEHFRDLLLEQLKNGYTAEGLDELFASEEYRDTLLEELSKPAYEGGIDFYLDDEGINIVYTRKIPGKDDFYRNIPFYYEDLQDELNPRYAVKR
ncbi:MAG: hypothetical protein IKI75_06085 [Lachnospiraceae bacterium]|nr:hypothetical protein [Lachnospiraceae bacterium]